MKLRASPVPALAKLALVLGPAMIAFGVWAFVQSGLIDQDEEGLAAGGMFTFWGIVIAVAGVRSKRHGATYVEIDEERGMIAFIENRVRQGTVPLHEIGELQVATVQGEHRLAASALPNAVLFRADVLLPVEQRRVRLERLRDAQLIRQVLLTDAPSDGAYRDDPDLAFRVRKAVPDRVRLDEVLAELQKEPSLAPRVELVRRKLRE